MARQDQPTGTPDVSGRLDDLERRLDSAFHRLAGRGNAAAESEVESLRARRARLRDRLTSEPAGTSVLGEIEALSDAIDNWVANLDRDQRRADQGHSGRD